MPLPSIVCMDGANNCRRLCLMPAVCFASSSSSVSCFLLSALALLPSYLLLYSSLDKTRSGGGEPLLLERMNGLGKTRARGRRRPRIRGKCMDKYIVHDQGYSPDLGLDAGRGIAWELHVQSSSCAGLLIGCALHAIDILSDEIDRPAWCCMLKLEPDTRRG